ncbi:MAG: LamG-like jellyroll fold domain-containing protein [Patescibacteria group bacterium]
MSSPRIFINVDEMPPAASSPLFSDTDPQITDKPADVPGKTGGETLLSSLKELTVGVGDTVFHADKQGIWLGSKQFNDATFRVNMAGQLYATGATISGSISASTIDIGGSDTTSWHVDINGNQWAGEDAFNTATNPFSVTNAGILRATGAIISGAITVTAGGVIGGFDIGSDYIRDTANSFGLASTVTSATELFSSTLFSDPNIVSYWRLEASSVDSVGSNNGTDTAITYSAGNGKFNNGAGFNGTSSQIYSQSSSFDISGTANFTIAVWVKLTALPTTATSYFDVVMTQEAADTTTYDKGIRIYGNGSASLYAYDGATKEASSAASSVAAGTYTSLIGTYDGTTLRLYVNGTLAGSVACSSTYNFTTPRLVFGHKVAAVSLSEYLNGAIDDAAYFSRALSASEIAGVAGGDDVRFWSGAAFADRVTASMWIKESGAMKVSSIIITGLQAGSSVDGQYLASLSVTAASIANATITGGKIATATITAANITAATITGTEIANATITGGKIALATITAANITAATITAAEIANATITGSKIAAGTITATNITAATITATEIANATITGAKIAAGTITASNITAATITAAEIANGTITGAKIASATITGANIASATIAGANIASATITGGNIAAATITGGNIASATISAANIVSATITTAEIASGTITGANIASSTITGANIAATTITATNITALTITAAEIANLTINGAKISSGAITPIKTTMPLFMVSAGTFTDNSPSAGSVAWSGVTIQFNGTEHTITSSNTSARYIVWDSTSPTAISGSATVPTVATTWLIGMNNSGTFLKTWDMPQIHGEQIQAATITGSQIGVATITATNITAATITATQIAAGTITATEIAAATITGAKIASGTITSTNIQDATITGADIASATITATNIANATITTTQISGTAGITGSQIANTTITAANITNATITTSQISATAGITGGQIASTTITSANISNATITTTQIANSTITGSNIANNTIAAANIVNATITATQIAAATITATEIANATITGAKIASGTITASNIASATITATQIATATITATNIASLTITAAEIANATITAGKLTISQLSAITADMGTITAGTVTGATIRTAASGARFQMTSTAFQGINGAGSTIFEVIVSGADAGDVIMGDDATGAYAKWDDSAGTFNVYANNTVTTSQGTFGGDGSDGALSTSSGTTTIDLGGAAYFVKNYTTVSITGTATVVFTNPHANGTFILIKCQGAMTMTTSAVAFNASGCGADTATNASYIYDALTHNGTSGANTSGAAGGAAGAQLALRTLYLFQQHKTFIAAPGAGGGSGGGGFNNNGSGFPASNGIAGGIGGRGGGVLIFECNGAWNFTTGSISVAGQAGTNGTDAGATTGSGGAGGGGGGGGMIGVLYRTLTADSGTYTITGGALGTGGICNPSAPNAFASGAGGGGAGSWNGAGTAGAAGSWSASNPAASGGTGADGLAIRQKNITFA